MTMMMTICGEVDEGCLSVVEGSSAMLSPAEYAVASSSAQLDRFAFIVLFIAEVHFYRRVGNISQLLPLPINDHF